MCEMLVKMLSFICELFIVFSFQKLKTFSLNCTMKVEWEEREIWEKGMKRLFFGIRGTISGIRFSFNKKLPYHFHKQIWLILFLFL